MDCEIADWVYERASAAAENEPRLSTSWRTFRRPRFSISRVYTEQKELH
jgi:hypothetical protein